jgi:hypothetical protein
LIAATCSACSSFNVDWGGPGQYDLVCLDCGRDFPQYLPIWFRTPNSVTVTIHPLTVEIPTVRDYRNEHTQEFVNSET